jgi:hypothetical protein
VDLVDLKTEINELNDSNVEEKYTHCLGNGSADGFQNLSFGWDLAAIYTLERRNRCYRVIEKIEKIPQILTSRTNEHDSVAYHRYMSEVELWGELVTDSVQRLFLFRKQQLPWLQPPNVPWAFRWDAWRPTLSPLIVQGVTDKHCNSCKLVHA